jgi:hypothetical protein
VRNRRALAASQQVAKPRGVAKAEIATGDILILNVSRIRQNPLEIVPHKVADRFAQAPVAPQCNRARNSFQSARLSLNVVSSKVLASWVALTCLMPGPASATTLCLWTLRASIDLASAHTQSSGSAQDQSQG